MAGAALAVTALFQLARRRIQRVVPGASTGAAVTPTRRPEHGMEVSDNCGEGEPITSTLTVGRDLGKGRFAQRFLVVPW